MQLNHHPMNCQSLPAWWSPKQHNKHPRGRKNTTIYLPIPTTRPQETVQPWRPEERCSTMKRVPGCETILGFYVHIPGSFPKTPRHCFPDYPGFLSLLTQFTCMPSRQQQHQHEASHPSDPFSFLPPPANNSQHCWRPSQPLTLFYLNFRTST